ncbi:MAG: BatA (Bacteroides aerotolerance operon) [uncultured Thiotrichaceae bacterium]|uniref:BatA (Bacteroides aerotolerance operon) n=1 Tax=uncultured Thiotrichaceae bacterium TaxID=298394 RepID=A0A6S6U164_9GAMM|nr:MAG: BatA (Bacteroides aerotolerance operon) [uncultured Thiotrichaceae bacterium]
MFEFQWIYFLVLLPLPILMRRLFKSVQSSQQAALKLPDISVFQEDAISVPGRSKKIIKILMILAWLAVVIAVARPIWVGDPISLSQSARNIMMAVDLSGSMEQRDFRVGGANVSRLAATKKVATDFILRRENDRLGLILFGDNAYVQVPLTLDRHSIVRLLDEAVLGLAGERTAIGNAIALAVKRTIEKPDEKHVLVLMTDGAATAGVDVAEATRLAADAKLKIYTVGIGSVSRGGFMSRRNDLDEPALKAIAEQTNGVYFRARNTKEFEDIYAKLDELEPVTEEEQWWRPRKDLFHWPLTVSLFLLMIAYLIKLRANHG